MMVEVGLCEINMVGNEYTWSNKHSQCVIYSKIDRALGNMDWFQKYHWVNVDVLEPHISDHCPLYLNVQVPAMVRRQGIFKFMNYVAKKEGFLETVQDVWSQHVSG